MRAEQGASPGRSGRPRARDLGVRLPGEPGAWNAITDVAGVEVGYETLIDGDGPLVVGAGSGPHRGHGDPAARPGGRGRRARPAGTRSTATAR